MSNGTVIQIIGAVIDVEFPKENLPKIYDALTVDRFKKRCFCYKYRKSHFCACRRGNPGKDYECFR